MPKLFSPAHIANNILYYKGIIHYPEGHYKFRLIAFMATDLGVKALTCCQQGLPDKIIPASHLNALRGEFEQPLGTSPLERRIAHFINQ